MSSKPFFTNKLLSDFIYLFSSNIVKKILGFVREILLAFFFGSSTFYANFLILKTTSDFFSQFTFGNALQANLMPKFTKLYSLNVSLNLRKIFLFTKKISFRLFLFSQLIQIPLIWIFNFDNKLIFVIIAVVLGLLISINFLNSIFLTIFQSKGEFSKYSFATTLNIFISTLLLYPLVIILDLIGVAISRLIGVIILFLKYIKPLLLQNGKLKPNLNFGDFNLNLLMLGNFATILILVGRFSASIDGGNDITFFTYAIIILSTILNAIITNINTLVLKIISIKKNLWLVLISTFISLIIGIILVVIIEIFSIDIIKFIYERGAFNNNDTDNTAFFLRRLSWSFIFIFMATTLFQPFFTLDSDILRKHSKFLVIYLFLSFISIVLFIFLNDYSNRINTIIIFQSLSVVYFFLSLKSLYIYRKYAV